MQVTARAVSAFQAGDKFSKATRVQDGCANVELVSANLVDDRGQALDADYFVEADGGRDCPGFS
jgi:hypothetical protein